MGATPSRCGTGITWQWLAVHVWRLLGVCSVVFKVHVPTSVETTSTVLQRLCSPFTRRAHVLARPVHSEVQCEWPVLLPAMYGYHPVEVDNDILAPAADDPTLPSSYVRDPRFNLTLNNCACLRDYALLALNTHDTLGKVNITYAAHLKHKQNTLPITSFASVLPPDLPPPAHPARPLHLVTVPVDQLHLVVKGDTNGNRLRMLHSLAHIESYAIDLSWDILLRWLNGVSRADVLHDVRTALAAVQAANLYDAELAHDDAEVEAEMLRAAEEGGVIQLPDDFYYDWLRIACEESRHFSCWSNRLVELSSSYGAFPTHAGLWQSAAHTHHSLLARLAIVHAVHEAHGLDASLRMAKQLSSSGDKKSQTLLLYIESDEQTHVSSGLRWFRWLLQQVGLTSERMAVRVFHGLVLQYWKGKLHGPFNVEARRACGMSEQWYMPLVSRDEQQQRERSQQKAEEKDRERKRRVEDESARRRQQALLARAAADK